MRDAELFLVYLFDLSSPLLVSEKPTFERISLLRLQ